ncbi:MAG: hypothetical protein RLZZ480_127 [Candidatus Parcubacteria bacterium]|jgi:hypothetical protein
MPSPKELRRLLKANITIPEIIVVCEAFILTITEENFSTTEDSYSTNNIFSDHVTIRTIENWISKVAYDIYHGKNRAESRALKITEIIDIEIRKFAEAPEHLAAIQRLLRRKLTSNDVIRLLWVGDQGHEFARRFFTLFIAHLRTFGMNTKLTANTSEDDTLEPV